MSKSESEPIKGGKIPANPAPRSVSEDRREHSESKNRRIRFDQEATQQAVDSQPAFEGSDKDEIDLGLMTDAIPASSYEWLGFRTVEPTWRKPFLDLNAENKSRVAWANRDCNQSSAMLRRARPLRTLEAAFFDRLEMMRRVALSEVAKADGPMEAVAVLGIVFDREQLMLAAEEVHGPTKGREIVAETKPGNYDELAMKIAVERRPRRAFKKREYFAKSDGAKGTKVLSKMTPPYLLKPFRSRGTGLLYSSRCPGAEATYALTIGGRKSYNRINESKLVHMESLWSAKAIMPMVEKWSTNCLEGSSTTIKEQPGS